MIPFSSEEFSLFCTSDSSSGENSNRPFLPASKLSLAAESIAASFFAAVLLRADFFLGPTYSGAVFISETASSFCCESSLLIELLCMKNYIIRINFP